MPAAGRPGAALAEDVALQSLFRMVDRAGARDGAAVGLGADLAAALAVEAGRQAAAAHPGAGDGVDE